MSVSVCIPVFNGETYLAEAISSVLAQTYQDFELVVVDNASTDRTPEVLRELTDTRVRVVRNESTLPAAENWNLALSHCSREFVKLVCADDRLEPECLERQVEALRAAGADSAALAAARRDVIDHVGSVRVRSRGLGPLHGVVDGRTAVRACVRAGTNLLGEPAGVLMRRSALDAVGGFDSRHSYMIDLELWCRLLGTGDLVAMPETLSAFRVHPGSWSASLTRSQAQQARSLFDELQQRWDGISVADGRLGAVRATGLSYARQLAYAWWGWRLRR